MKYWDEMDDKYGFGDGGAYPPGVELYRDVYVKTVSRLAEIGGSAFRIVPLDRAGAHNYCLWESVPKDWFENEFLPKQNADLGVLWKAVDFKDLPPDMPIMPQDEALETAIEKAMSMDLDSFVVTSPFISRVFTEEVLPGLKMQHSIDAANEIGPLKG